MKKSSTIKLMDEVADKFTVTDHASRLSDGKWGRVDLNKIDLSTAKRLMAEGFPYLKEKRKQSGASED